MRKADVLGLLPVVLLAISLPGCKAHEPSRPRGVPASAVWVGGQDGGVFIECTPSRDSASNACTVYNDSTGDVYLTGQYLLKGTGRGARKDELRYVTADGDNIYLDRNLALVPGLGEKPLRR